MKKLFKKNKNINLEKGKEIFLKYNGDYFFIDREEHAQEYRECNIPKEVENNWTNELKNILLNDIKNETSYYYLTSKFVLLNNINIPIEEKFHFLNEYLSKPDLDTFTIILLCEELKRVTRYSKKYENQVNEILLDKFNNISKITIDNSYKRLMNIYDFSEENLRRRINSLLK